MPASNGTLVATAYLDGESQWTWLLCKEAGGIFQWYLDNGHRTTLTGTTLTEAEENLREHVSGTLRGTLIVSYRTPSRFQARTATPRTGS